MLTPTVPNAAGTIDRMMLHAPVVEETIYRLGLQKLLLNDLPARFLGQKTLNPIMVRCARIAFHCISLFDHACDTA
jgi:NADH:ubiquinone oxidoreductase subunit D